MTSSIAIAKAGTAKHRLRTTLYASPKILIAMRFDPVVAVHFISFMACI
jgi:hypothetical protein